MLRNQEICNFLNKNLSGEHTFKIFSEIGRSKDDGAIHGVLTRNNPQMTPLSDVIVNDYNFTIELSIPAQLGNKYLESVEKTISDFAKEWNGKEYPFKDGKGTLHFNLTSTGNFNTSSRVGNQVPLVFGLTIVYTEDVVTSLNKHWLLDGVEIPFISEDVMLEKEGITKPIQGKQYKQTLLTGQTKFYHFRMYFKEGLATTLHQDILQGDFEKTYKLEYYDGVSFTQENKFETTVSIFRSANANSEKPRASVLDIIFSDVEPFENGTIYELGLFDDDFDAQTENTRFFSATEDKTAQEVQRDYYDSKVANGVPYQRIKAPNLDSLNITNQVYRNEAMVDGKLVKNYFELFNLTNKNKAVIRVGKKIGNNEPVYEKYFYYDVTNSVIGADYQVSYDLALDSLQTYYFGNVEFDGTFIQKAHLDRWIDNGDGTITFNGKADSDLFEREEVKDVAKRLVKREKLKYYAENVDQDILNMINTIDAWVYVYLNGNGGGSAGEGYTIIKVDGGQKNDVKFKNAYFNIGTGEETELPTAILVFPLNREFDETYFYVGKTQNDISYYTFMRSAGWKSFVELNPNIAGQIYSIKLSVKPPFNLNDLNSSSSPYNATFKDKVLFFEPNDATSDIQSFGIDETQNKYVHIIRTKKGTDVSNFKTFEGLFYITNDYLDPVEFVADIEMPQITFGKSSIVNKLSNKNFNPKLNSQDYKTLAITFGGAKFEYPIDKLFTEQPRFEYFETFTPEVTRGLLRFKTESNDNVFNDAYSSSFNGFSISNDFTIAFSKSAYESYIANNKNAYLSMANQIDYQSYQYAQKSTNNIIDIIKNPTSLFSETGQILNDTVSTAMQMQYQMAQFDLSMDNMRSAPETLSHINGSALLTNLISKFGFYAEIYEGLEIELNMINDIMTRDGYTYNRFGNLKLYDNIRKYFNYVRATIGNINGTLSNIARQNIRQRFASGVRFWNMVDGDFKVDYTKENYEQWLEN